MATFSTATQTTADLEANANLVKALSGYASANRALINTAVSEQARTFRTLQKVIGDFNNANNTGSASGYMRAAVDLATAPLKNEPVDQRLANDVSTFLDAHPGRFASDPDMAKAIWQDAARKHLPDSVQAWGNVDYLRKQTGLEGKSDEEILAVVTDNSTDPRAADALRMMLDQARRQQQVIDMSKNLQADLKPSVDVLLGRYGSVDNIPQAELEKWKREHQPELLRARTAFGMADIKALADAEANKEVVLTGTAKEAYDFNVEMQKRLTAQSTTESDRDRAAKLINSPMFREWAQSNGFDIGHIEEPDPNREYAPGELTTSGVYVPGRDDYKAVMLAQRQLSMDPNKAHPFMAKGAGIKGELKKYGALDVQLAPPGAAPAPAAAPEPPAAEEFTDAAGWKYRLYNGEVSVIGGPKGKETAATPANPLKLPPEDAQKAVEEHLIGIGVPADAASAAATEGIAGSKAPALAPAAAEPAAKPASEKVYGAIGRSFAGDPIGSRRLNGQLYLKDESTGKFYRAPEPETGVAGETITSAQGPNALKAFAEEVRARRASNIARRLEDKEGGAKAPLRTAAIGLAQTLTPERQTEAEKARAVEYNRQQEMERRAQNQALEDTAPGATSRNIPSVTPAGIGMAPVEGALQAPGPSTSPLSAAQAEPLRQVAPAAPALDAELLRRRQAYPNAETEAALARDAALFTKNMPRPEPAPYDAAAQAAYEQVLNETSVASPPPPPPPAPAPVAKTAPKATQRQTWMRGEPLSDRDAKAREWLATPLTVAKPAVDYKNILEDEPAAPASAPTKAQQKAEKGYNEVLNEPTPVPKQTSQRGAMLNQRPVYRDLYTVPTAGSAKTPSSMA